MYLNTCWVNEIAPHFVLKLQKHWSRIIWDSFLVPGPSPNGQAPGKRVLAVLMAEGIVFSQLHTHLTLAVSDLPVFQLCVGSQPVDPLALNSPLLHTPPHAEIGDFS